MEEWLCASGCLKVLLQARGGCRRSSLSRAGGGISLWRQTASVCVGLKPCVLPAGTLMVFAVVALALIVKRVVKPQGTWAENAKPSALIFLMTGCCIGEAPEGFWGVSAAQQCVPVQQLSVLAASAAPAALARASRRVFAGRCLLYLPPATGTAIRHRAGHCKC